jgi:hypothetical protein
MQRFKPVLNPEVLLRPPGPPLQQLRCADDTPGWVRPKQQFFCVA